MIDRRNDHEGEIIQMPHNRYFLDVGWASGEVSFLDGTFWRKETAPVFRKLCAQGEEAVKKLAKAHGWKLELLTEPAGE